MQIPVAGGFGSEFASMMTGLKDKKDLKPWDPYGSTGDVSSAMGQMLQMMTTNMPAAATASGAGAAGDITVALGWEPNMVLAWNETTAACVLAFRGATNCLRWLAAGFSAVAMGGEIAFSTTGFTLPAVGAINNAGEPFRYFACRV